ncbi:MAG: phospholipid carrier-dependent glycosyltransferase [Anaerolineae bacterium]|nr:phospholipid carrier-dependent glycosyltransferase [Anaerolineae bacterium]
MNQRQKSHWLALLLLLLFLARLLHTESLKSITYDEPPHVLNAVQYFQPRPMVSTINNPPLIHALMGGLVHLTGLTYDMGYTHDVWAWGNGFDIAQIFFWQLNTNWPQFFWVGRLMVIFLALFLASLVYRWAGQLYAAPAPALLALLLTFDPNILAFSHLATTDLGVALFFTLAGYSLWGYWRQPTWARLVWAGMAVGLAIAAKFSGAAIILAFLLMMVYRWWAWDRSKVGAVRMVGVTAVILTIAAFVLLAVYRFQFSLLVADYRFQQTHFSEGHEAYLLGEISRSGWWYYYPVVFLAKTPIGLLVLLGLGVALFVWAGAINRPLRTNYSGGADGWERGWLLLLAGTIFVGTLAGSVNIGYRYLLPALPPLYIFLGQLVLPQTAVVWRWVTAVALAFFIIASVRIHPHYLAFFNVLAGGPENGWRVAVDSNIDWGQDLEAVGRYLAERGITDAHIAWFSTAMPQRYGIPGRSFLTWPPSHRDPVYDEWYPERPLPGIYVISATQLAGPYLQEQAGQMAWFRQRQPDAKVGHSYFIYEVKAEGAPAGLALSGIGVAMLEPETMALLTDGNNISLRHFDGRTSFLWPGGGLHGGAESVWTAVGEAHRPGHPLLQKLYPPAGPTLMGERTIDGQNWRYHLYQWPASPIQPGTSATDTAVFGETLQFLGYETAGYKAGRPLELLTYWRVNKRDGRNLKLFIHILDESGHLVAQHDGLDVLAAGLPPGDEFAQLHTLPLPVDLPPGQYTVQTGVYDAATLTRLPLLPDETSRDTLTLFTFVIE